MPPEGCLQPLRIACMLTGCGELACPASWQACQGLGLVLNPNPKS
jgi:hypothetical protein